MEYRIRIQPGKEKAFQEFLKALRTLGVVEEVKMATEAESQKEREEKQGCSPEELASQYRDLVD